MERLWDSRHLCHTKWEAAVDTWVSSSSRKCYTSKGIYMFSSTFSFLPSRGSHISLLCTTAAHLQQNASFCLNYHWWCDKRIESQQIMFTSRTELIKASLGCCDAPFLYLRLMIRVISVLQPPPPPTRMCCFPSRQGYLEYCVEYKCVCDLFFKLYEWPFERTAQFGTQGRYLLKLRKEQNPYNVAALNI